MIISKTPFRMSFVGGGTDLPAFYEEETGAVLSTTIDKHMYIAVHKYFEDKYLLKYSEKEKVDAVEDIEHPLIRESLKTVPVDDPIEITSIADIPSGTGLGSSSSFTVGLLHALWAYNGRDPHPSLLADKACEVEIDKAGSPIGKQDQTAAAYGGVNFIEFHPDGSIEVEPIQLDNKTRVRLSNNLLAVYTGGQRDANEILEEQSEETSKDEKFTALQEMKQLAYDLREEFKKGNIDALGPLLHRNWELKRELASGITNPRIDEAYEQARQAGATGGKLLGAGGSGFLLFYCPDGKDDVASAIDDMEEFTFTLDPMGSRIMHQEHEY